MIDFLCETQEIEKAAFIAYLDENLSCTTEEEHANFIAAAVLRAAARMMSPCSDDQTENHIRSMFIAMAAELDGSQWR
ncbi:MAG: hypothetical protein ACO24H_08500 [Polynucleobacter sp.]